MKKKILYFFILLNAIFIFVFLFQTPVQAAKGDEGTIGMTLEDIGYNESEYAKAADPLTKYLIEQTWRQRINEILNRLRARGVDIDTGILDAALQRTS